MAPSRLELLDAYRRHVRVICQRPASTWKHYERVLVGFFDWLAPKPPTKATPELLMAYLDRRPERFGRVRSLELSASTRHHYAYIIQRFYAWATAEGLIRVNPLAGMRPPPAPNPAPRAIAHDDVQRFLTYIAGQGDLRLLVEAILAYGMGLRCIEIARLKVEDVELGESPTIWLHRKRGKRQRLPLHPAVAEVLAAHIAAEDRRYGPLLASRSPNNHGGAMTAMTISRHLTHAFRAAKVPGTAHGLRHSFATELLAAGQGLNVHAVAHLLGHDSTELVERVYGQTYHADAWRDIKTLAVPDVLAVLLAARCGDRNGGTTDATAERPGAA